MTREARTMAGIILITFHRFSTEAISFSRLCVTGEATTWTMRYVRTSSARGMLTQG